MLNNGREWLGDSEEIQVCGMFDYPLGDPARSQIMSGLYANLPRGLLVREPEGIAIREFSSWDLGVALLDMKNMPRTHHGKRQVWLGNSAVRESDAEDCISAPFVLAEFRDDQIYMGTTTGHELSFVRDRIRRIRVIDIPSGGTQFRSFYLGLALARFLRGDKIFLEEYSIERVPDAPVSQIDSAGRVIRTRLARIDNFKNMKFLVAQDELNGTPFGSAVTISLAGHVLNDVNLGTCLSDGPKGGFVLCPGSSTLDSQDNPTPRRRLELVRVKGHAALRFRHESGMELYRGIPWPGTEVIITVNDELSSWGRSKTAA